MKISIYCDGSSDGKSGGLGGWGFVILLDGQEIAKGSGQSKNATNNSEELRAAINGMEWYENAKLNNIIDAMSITEVELVSDSQLCLGYANGTYKCKAMHLVPLYIKLRKLYAQVGAKTRWCKGHSGDKYNEICDKLAKEARTSIETKNKTL